MNNVREYFERLASGEILERKTGKFVLKKLNEAEMFSYERESTLGEVAEARTLHKLDCNHVVGAIGPQEYEGDCGKCGASCCYRCGCSERCGRCRALLCPKHQRFLEDSAYCAGCRNVEVLRRAALATLCGLHALLSKET